MMKKLTMLVLFMCVLGLATHALAEKPKLIAAKFHADWCASCKAIDPAYQELQSRFADNNDIAFITLDKTDDLKDNNSHLLASSLGFGSVYKEHAKTGFVLLIDTNTGRNMGKLTKTLSADDMVDIVNKALDGEVYVDNSAMKGSGKGGGKGSVRKEMKGSY